MLRNLSSGRGEKWREGMYSSVFEEAFDRGFHYAEVR